MKAAIFDLDGTLVDSAPDIAHAVNRMLADRGAPAQQVAFIETLVGEGARMLVVKLHRALGLPEQDVDRDTRIYLDYYAARPVADSRLYADAATALPALRAAGHPARGLHQQAAGAGRAGARPARAAAASVRGGRRRHHAVS